MVVKHLVISGGGPSIFSIFGAVKYLHENGFWNINNIETIYCCSSGALLGICLCFVKLGLTFDELENYLINRSWDKLFVEEVLDFKTAFDSKGLFDFTTIKKAIIPLITAVNLEQEVTLKELFDITKIKLVAFSVDINKVPFEKVHISYSNFPDVPIYKALSMTMCVPGILTPTFIDDMCLIDGGLLVNYPYVECFEETQALNEEVLGLKIKWETRNLNIDKSSNLISFMSSLMRNMSIHIGNTTNIVPDNNNTIECKTPYSGGPADWIDIIGNNKLRKLYLDTGIESGKDFIADQKEKNLQTQQVSHT